jgi:O-methyltransferase involved in polyketide biosynthesis
MREGEPSRTALGVAGHRAAHQAFDGGRIFADALALDSDDAEDAIAAAMERPERRVVRLFVAMRSRFAEDAASQAIDGARGRSWR